MANETNLTKEEAYEIADKLALASARILEFRVEIRDPPLSNEEADELEKCEDSLDSLVVLFRSYGIQLIGSDANEAVTELKSAIDAAKKTLEKINTIKKTIRIAGAVVDLAVAVLAKDPKGIINAAKGVVTATNGGKSEEDKKNR